MRLLYVFGCALAISLIWFLLIRMIVVDWGGLNFGHEFDYILFSVLFFVGVYLSVQLFPSKK